MKVLEIKNNLAKLNYQSEENVALGRFIALEDSVRSYVGQVVNLKADIKANYAIARLLFTVSEDGIIDNYDGTIPSLDARVSDIKSAEITSLIPLEKPINFGYLAQQDTKLCIDQTFFENNPIICAEKYDNIDIIVHNFTDQLVKNNEKVVIIDIDHNYTEEKALRFKKDFKLPLDAKRVDYLINYELEGIEASTKAVIQDIFLEVKEYINSLPEGFLPFDTFLGVVSAQYETSKMPELALLKNKLLQYQNSFAQNKEEIYALKAEIQMNNITYIDIDEDSDDLQRELIEYIHENLQDIDKYLYLFVKLTSKNTDKKLLKELIETDKIFTTIICSHNHKYIQELKQRAQGIILFAPQTVQHDFATYNTFLNKLGSNEFIVFGKLTQDIPFIVELSDFAEETEPENDYQEEEPVATEEEMTESEEESGAEEPVFAADEESPIDIENETAENPVLEQEEGISVIEQEEIAPSEDTMDFENIPGPINNTDEAESAESETVDFSEFENLEITESNSTEEPENTETTDIEEDTISLFDEEPYIADHETIVSNDGNNLDTIYSEPIENEEMTHDELVDKVAKDVDEIYYNKAEEIPSIDELPENGEEGLTENDLDFIDELAPENEEIATLSEEPEDIVPENADNTPAEDTENADEFRTEPEEEIIVEEPQFEDVSTDYETEEELPVYPVEETPEAEIPAFEQGDTVTHPKYGKGVIEKLIKYGNKTLCSISFEDVGRRLLDPAMSELQKV